MKLVIFDFDGTLADTETLITQTMMKTIEAMHLEPRSREEMEACGAQHVIDDFADLYQVIV